MFVLNLNQLFNNFVKYIGVIRKCNVKVICIKVLNVLLDLMLQNMINVNDIMYVDFDIINFNKIQILFYFDNLEFNNIIYCILGYILF